MREQIEEQALDYETPIRPARPALYGAILSTAAGLFLIAFGALLTVGAFVFSYDHLQDNHGSAFELIAMVPLLVAGLVFLFFGIIHTRGTVRALRGKPYAGTKWERWFEQFSSRAYAVGSRQKHKHDESDTIPPSGA